jgi:hypothetical protein
MKVTLITMILLALATPAFAQGNRDTLEKQLAAKEKMEKTQFVLRELAQFEYKAKMDVPVSDSLFVSSGKMIDAMYNSAMRAGKVAIKSGQMTKVSQVELLDFAVLVSFADGSCTVIGTPSGTLDTKIAPAADLLVVAKESIAAYFETVKK